MRPKQLKMSAFGPYAGCVELDMEKLGTRGLYLITGDTGAGKTTIFDGIVYALYGLPSGENREPSMLRSKYADAQTPTEVELIFENGNQEYRIRRNPEYNRPAKKGGGMTLQRAEAELIYPDGRVVTKQKEVNKAIVQILGLDRNQFLQIAMIAQGDFLKLLLADTKERQGIFREIFKTGYYQVLQEKLKAESGKLSDELEYARRSIDQYLEGVTVPEDLTQIPLAEAIGKIQILVEQAQVNVDKINGQIENVQKELEETQEHLQKARTKEQTKQALFTANEEYTCLKVQEKNIQGMWESQKEKQNIRDELEVTIAQVQEEVSKYQELEDKKKKIIERKTFLLREEQKLQKLQTENERLQEQLLCCKSEEKQLENEPKRQAELQFQQEKLQIKQEELLAFGENIRQYQKLCGNLEKIQGQYVEKSETAKREKEKYDKAYQLFLDGQAGVLAKHLKEGEPCPVCGSREHPKKALAMEHVPSQTELELMKEDWEQARNQMEMASREAAELLGKVNAKKELISEKIKTQEQKEIQEQQKKVEDERKVLEVQIKENEEKVRRLKELQHQIQEIENQIRNSQIQREELSGQIASLKAEIETENKQLEKQRQSLRYEDGEEAKKQLHSLQIQKADMQKEYEEAQKKFQKWNGDIRKLEGQIEQCKNQLETLGEYEVAGEQKKKVKLEEERNVWEQKRKEIQVSLAANEKALIQIKKKSKDIIELEHQWSQVKALSNTANGNISGKEKIMLETYVQMTYFDRILERANVRFMVMSEGQYELSRSISAENNRSQSGLELDVIDHYNGTRRSVKTLSGGESFKASLSLALGLSDEVQSRAGGIHLDTMFVDEGFGSLDEESLEQAMKALAGLSEGNKLVGIISHVGELKERIDRQIVVTKEKAGGSRAEIVG